jgi:glutamate-1-semialdehyde 2,1-aminomutase
VRIPGFTSTRSKRPDVLFGTSTGVPVRAARTQGCTVWDADGRAYIDMVMALGAVGLGYAHPDVTAAVDRAVRDGGVGPLGPLLEEEVAELLCDLLPGVERLLFLKSGAEAVAAAVRIARAATGRDHVVTCGYHGWLDWCQDEPAVPASIRRLRWTIPFNDIDAVSRVADAAQPVAAFVIEPVVDAAPDVRWLEELQRVAGACGSVLVFDEIKTAFRLAVGGAAERWSVVPDLLVVGKALGNGFPLAVVGGRTEVMKAATKTWISSTLATEWVSLAAARAVIEVYRREDVCRSLQRVGTVLFEGLREVAHRRSEAVLGVSGLPPLCYLRFATDEVGSRLASGVARRGVLFKRDAYNFVSLAHTPEIVRDVLARLEEALAEIEAQC